MPTSLDIPCQDKEVQFHRSKMDFRVLLCFNPWLVMSINEVDKHIRGRVNMSFSLKFGNLR
jgi:hypothetical protein